MTTRKNEVSVIDFIQAVQNRPELWDVKNDNYKMKEKKKATWEILATEHGFQDGEAASKRWANLRDYYAKARKKSPNGSAGKPWPYTESMSFYQSVIEPNSNSQECIAFGIMVAEKLEKMSDYQRAKAEQQILQLINNINFGEGF